MRPRLQDASTLHRPTQLSKTRGENSSSLTVYRIRSGGVTGIAPPSPSHTTGRAVFRIRRLNSAATSPQGPMASGNRFSEEGPRFSAPFAYRAPPLLATHPGALEATFNKAPVTPKLRNFRARPFRLCHRKPEMLPDVPTYPAFQPVHRLPVLDQLEISPPASDEASPCVRQLVTGSALAASPQLPHFRFESFDALRCYSDLSSRFSRKPRNLRS